MIYICMFSDGYCYYEDENCKAFLNRRSGLEWVNSLNIGLAYNDLLLQEITNPSKKNDIFNILNKDKY